MSGWLIINILVQEMLRRTQFLMVQSQLTEKLLKKSSAKITQFDVVTIDISEQHYVSRAANKLKYLVTKTKIDIERKTCIDLGASTGALRKYFSNSVPQKSMRLMLVTNKWLISLEKINE